MGMFHICILETSAAGLPAVLDWRAPLELFEPADEVAKVAVPNLLADFHNRKRGSLEQDARLFNPVAVDILDKTDMQGV